MVNEDVNNSTDSTKAPRKRGKLFGRGEKASAPESASVPETNAVAEPVEAPPAKTPRKRATTAKSAADHVTCTGTSTSSKAC